MDPIRVFVVDAHPVVRYGVAAMLASDGSYRWVGQAAGVGEALAGAPAAQPDVVLLNQAIPGTPDGPGTLAALRAVLPGVRFVVMVPRHDAAVARQARAAGAGAVLPLDASARELVTALHAAYIGPLEPPAPAAEPQPPEPVAGGLGDDLTPRERELLALMARGLPNHEISARLAIAMPTVKFHVTNILAKLHVENRTGAVLAALRQGLVDLR
jgi:NarL family two-component system response regulator LiaR